MVLGAFLVIILLFIVPSIITFIRSQLKKRSRNTREPVEPIEMPRAVENRVDGESAELIRPVGKQVVVGAIPRSPDSNDLTHGVLHSSTPVSGETKPGAEVTVVPARATSPVVEVAPSPGSRSVVQPRRLGTIGDDAVSTAAAPMPGAPMPGARKTSPLTRLQNLPPLKRAVLWSEILQAPRGLEPPE